jgi:hypothetical protein
MALGDYWTTADADPRHLYHGVVIAIDEERRLNNGQPSLWARMYDSLDLTGDAEAELDAAEQLRQGAEVIMQNPAGLELRRMQMITEVGAEQNTMTIIMMPSEFVAGCGGRTSPPKFDQDRLLAAPRAWGSSIYRHFSPRSKGRKAWRVRDAKSILFCGRINGSGHLVGIAVQTKSLGPSLGSA